jgi:xanthine dehydrogenase accessory factor
VYDIALSVAACLRAGTRVDVAWPVRAHGFSARDRNEALALTPGGGRIGAVASGAANDQLSDLAGRGGAGRLVHLTVAEFEAQLAGLSGGGDLDCLLVPATELPAGLWDRLRQRDPVCLLTRLDGDRVTGIELYDQDTVAQAGEEAARLFGRAISDNAVTAEAVVTVFYPVPKLLIVGRSPIADALRANAELLGWQAEVVGEPGVATGVIAGLSALDAVVVAAHDLELAGPALEAALASSAGYLGGLGSRHMQQARADWLAYRGITDLTRLNGPAGLDIGARTPAEIAVSILAEALAVRSGRAAASLRDGRAAQH